MELVKFLPEILRTLPANWCLLLCDNGLWDLQFTYQLGVTDNWPDQAAAAENQKAKALWERGVSKAVSFQRRFKPVVNYISQ